jgi:hypothetical protein
VLRLPNPSEHRAVELAPLGEHDLQQVGARGRPFRVALPLLAVAVLLAGCGGGGRADDPAKVEAGLRQYLSTLDPFSSTFPTGSGPPHVKENSCKKVPTLQGRIVRPPKAQAPRVRLPKLTKAQARFLRLLAGSSPWSCVVTFRGTYSLPVNVIAKANGEVLEAQPSPRGSSQPPVQSPATTYEGGPGKPKP